MRLAIGDFLGWGLLRALFGDHQRGPLHARARVLAGAHGPGRATGSPRIFVSHGVRDGVLPIDRCSRSIIPELKRGGYDVLYREFDGEHSISLEIALEAIGWFTQQKSPKGPVSAVPGADLLALRPQLRVALVK